MRSYRSTFACALALISSVVAQGLPVAGVSELVSSITAQDSLPTDIPSVPSVVPSTVSSAIDSVASGGSLPTGAISSIVGSVSSATSGDSLPTGAISSVVGSPTGVASSFPTDLFPAFQQLTELKCTYGSIIVSPATNGVNIPVAQAASAPSFSTSSALDGPYILIMIDPDVDDPQILHFMQPGMVSASGKNSSSVALTASEPAAVEYAGPAPPAGSGPHRYIILLFTQPDDFELSDSFDASDRVGFDVVSFAVEHSLGAPIAGTFFVAENVAGNLTSGLPGNGTFANGTRIGGSFNGTFTDGRGNSTNSTLHGSFLHSNGTSGNSTLNGGGRNGNGTTSGTNGTTLGTNGTSSSSSGSNDDSSSGSSTGPVPISPSSQAGASSVDESASVGESSALFANFAFAGFVALVTVGVTCM